MLRRLSQNRIAKRPNRLCLPVILAAAAAPFDFETAELSPGLSIIAQHKFVFREIGDPAMMLVSDCKNQIDLSYIDG